MIAAFPKKDTTPKNNYNIIFEININIVVDTGNDFIIRNTTSSVYRHDINIDTNIDNEFDNISTIKNNITNKSKPAYKNVINNIITNVNIHKNG